MKGMIPSKLNLPLLEMSQKIPPKLKHILSCSYIWLIQTQRHRSSYGPDSPIQCPIEMVPPSRKQTAADGALALDPDLDGLSRR